MSTFDEGPDQLEVDLDGLELDESGMLGRLLAVAIRRGLKAGLSIDQAVEASSEAISVAMPEMAKVVLVGLHRTKQDLLEGLASDRERLHQAINHDFGTALGNYEAVAHVAFEIGAQLHEEYVDSGTADKFLPSCQVLFLLHGRACTTGAEVLHLMRGGFENGAAARHRTLHEVAVVMDLLASDSTQELSQRYLDFAVVEQYEDMCHFQNNADALNQAPFDPEELAALRAEFEHVISQYGEQFRLNNQWAAPLFPGKKRVTFRMLEEKAGVSHKRPYYRLANHYVHAGPRAALMNLHERGTFRSMIGVGARSGEDIAEIATSSLVHLLHCTASLVVHMQEHMAVKFETMLGLETIQQFLDDAMRSFGRASQRL